jgi:pyruvate/2-oxoglutarate dehydrogenase complex dihydrolipoamide dehydrogenase (E3) component
MHAQTWATEAGVVQNAVVDEHLRTNVPHIWALGDVIGRIELTPVALMEGMAFAANCFGTEGLKPPDYGSVPSAVRSPLQMPLQQALIAGACCH